MCGDDSLAVLDHDAGRQNVLLLLLLFLPPLFFHFCGTAPKTERYEERPPSLVTTLVLRGRASIRQGLMVNVEWPTAGAAE